MATPAVKGTPRGREEIIAAALDAADRLFAEHGPHAVSLRDIANEAGVTYSLLNRHLGTRDELLRALLTRYEQRWRERMADAGLATQLEALLGSAPSPGRYNRLLAWAELGRRDEGRSVHREHVVLHELIPLASEHGLEEPLEEIAARLALILGWRFFGPFLLDVLHVEASDRDRLHAAMVTRVTRDLGQVGADPL